MTATTVTPMRRTYAAVQVNWPADPDGQFPARTTFQPAGTHLSAFAAGRGATSQVVRLTVTVGQDVQVWAFGRPRPGVVTALAPKRIEVRFVQNVNGTQSTRKFRPDELLAGGTQVDQLG